MEPITKDADGRVLLKSLTLPQLADWVASIGDKPFRAKQLWRWIHVRLASDFSEMTDLSRPFRERLAELARLDVFDTPEVYQAADGTRKLLWTTLSGAQVESVLIPTESRNTLCISSQVGCAINCQFCLTAKMGLRGQLSTAEIVDQVIQTRRLFGAERELTNIVFMGMGEPLHNPDNVIPATQILTDRDGLDFSRRKVTVSTSGLVPAIVRLGEETRVRLAVSLNATTDDVRDWVMPINRRFPLSELMRALRAYPLSKGERITFEYVMLDGVNDSDEDARRIPRLTNGIPCKVNLIPFNPHEGTEFRTSPRERVDAFRAILLSKGIHTTVRETRGDDRMAACGQLGRPTVGSSPRRVMPPERFRDALN